MSCYDLFEPYIAWAAKEQAGDPYRYLLGFTLTTIHDNGTVQHTDGTIDIHSAEVSAETSRFEIVLFGSGQRTEVPKRLPLLPNTTPKDGDGDIAQSRVLIHLRATPTEITVRVADVTERRVVEEVTVECTRDHITGRGEGRVHFINLQLIERRENGFVQVDTAEVVDEMTPTRIAPADDIVIPDKPDDLKKLEGVGDDIEKTLNSLGITTFAQLSTYTPERLEEELQEAGQEIVPGTLVAVPAQAALAAAGQWDVLRFIQEEVLYGGRVALKDNLQRIYGIGARTAAALYQLDITTFEKLSKTNPESLEVMLKMTGLRVPSGAASTWAMQARLAANFEWEALEKLQRELAAMDETMRRA